MGLLDNIIQGRGYQKVEEKSIEAKGALATGDSWAEIFGGSSSGPAFTSFNNQKEQLQAYTDWVYAATRYIAESCAAIDLRLFVNHTTTKNATMAQKLIYQPKTVAKYFKQNKTIVTKGDDGKLTTKTVAALEEVENHPLLDLLDRPNPYMTRMEFFEMTFLHLELAGEAFWAINRQNENPKNPPMELWPLMPNLIQVVADKEKFIAGYIYTVNGEQLPFAPEDIIHHKYANPNDLRRGMSTVSAAARIIDTDNHMADYNRRIFYNGATVDAVLYTDNKLTDQNWKRLQAQWKDNYSGSSNAHKTAILENGLKYMPMALNNKDLDFLKGMDFNRDMILALFGVPKSLLGMDESMSRANAETAEYVFAKNKLRSKMLRLTTRITEDLAVQFDNRIMVSFTDPVPDDKEFLLTEKKASIGSNSAVGWKTVNEVRAEDGMEEVEGGDELWISGTMIPLERAAMEPEDDPNEPIDPNDPSLPDTDPSSDDDSGVDDSDEEDTSNSDANTDEDESGSPTSQSGKTVSTDKKKDSSVVVHDTESEVEEANKKQFRTQQEVKDAQPDFEIIRDKVVARYEEKFLKVSHKRFEQQRKEVIGNFKLFHNAHKTFKPRSKDVKDSLKNLFDNHKSEVAWLAALIPLYKGAMATMGQAAMDNVTGDKGLSAGTSEQFSTVNASLAGYYQERATLISVGIDDATQKLLGATLTEGLTNKESLGELVDRIEGVYGAAAGYRAERIARTESIASTTRATIEGWEQSGVVEGKMWQVAGYNVCPYCLSLQGKVLRLKDDFFKKGDKLSVDGVGSMSLDYTDVEGPPVHVNCACTLMAILVGTYDFDSGKPKE